MVGGEETPPSRISSEGGGAGVSTERSPPLSHISSEGGDGGVRKPSTSH